MKNSLFLILLCFLILFSYNASAFRCEMIDTHNHLFQDGRIPGAFIPDGKKDISPGQAKSQTNSATDQNPVPDPGYNGSAVELVQRMNQTGVSCIILMPPPKTIENQIPKELDSLRNAVLQYKGTLYLAGGGESLNPYIQSTPPKSVTEKIKKDFRTHATDLAESGIIGFGEMAALHLSLSEEHVFEETQPDHPLFLELADVAAEYRIPISLHMEAVPENMTTPKDVSSRNPQNLQENIRAFERLLGYNRNASVIWEHAGWDNTGWRSTELMDRLLTDHPNLYCAFKVRERNPTIDGGAMLNRPVNESGVLLPEWRNLILKHPDRFIIGTDTFTSNLQTRLPQSWNETWSIPNQLPDDIALKVRIENACKIYKITGCFQNRD